MKALKTIFIVVLFIVTGVIIAIFAGRRFGFFGGAAVVSKSDSVSIKAFKDIEVEADALNFKIEEGTDYHVEYNCPSNMIPVINVNGDKLKIECKANGGVNFLNFNDLSKENFSLTVYVPEGKTEYGNLDIKIDAGNVVLDGFTFEDLKADLDAGNLELSNITAGDVTVNADAGNVELKDCIFKNVEGKVGAGNLEILDTKMENVKLEADMGYVKMKTVEFKEAEIEADLGKVTVTGTYEKLTAESSMGDIDVENENDDAVYDLTVDMGVISVNDDNKGKSYKSN